MGPGTMRRLLEAGVLIREITHVLLTHFHPDHTGELVPFLFSNKYGLDRPRTCPLTLVAGPGFKSFFTALYGIYGSWIDLGDLMNPLVEMSHAGVEETGQDGFELKTAPMRHSKESVGYKITCDGAHVVCSGDTEACASLEDLSKNADLAVFESAFPERLAAKGHMTPLKAGAIASSAGVKRLVLTHFYPVYNPGEAEAECRKSWAGPLVLATDLLQLNVK
jgi:ribonuclease BN (tRNA processing enzyme)